MTTTKLLKTLDVCAFLSSYGVDWATKHKNVSEGCVGVCCPFCGDDESYHLGIFADYKNWSCWRCSKKGNFYGLIKKLLNFSWVEYINALEQHTIRKPRDKNTIAERIQNIMQGEEEIVDEKKTAVSWPDSTVPIESLRGDKRIDRFIESRNFTWSDFIFNDARVCISGKYANRIILPIYQNDLLVGWQARGITNNQDPKYLNPPFSIHDYLYNYDGLTTSDTAIIVEGIFDCWRLKELPYKYHISTPWPVGLFFSTINSNHIKLLKDKGIKDILICLDADAYAKSIKLAKICAPFFDSVGVVKLKEGDPDSAGVDAFIDALENTHYI